MLYAEVRMFLPDAIECAGKTLILNMMSSAPLITTLLYNTLAALLLECQLEMVAFSLNL